MKKTISLFILSLVLVIAIIHCNDIQEPKNIKLEVDNLEKLIEFQKNKLEILQKIREKILQQNNRNEQNAENISDDQDSANIRDMVREEMQKLILEQEQSSPENLRVKNEVLNSLNQQYAFKLSSPITYFLPIKTRKYRAVEDGEVAHSTAYIITDQTEPNKLKLLNVFGEVNDEIENFPLTENYEDAGLYSTQIKGAIITSTLLSYVDEDFNKKELSVIITDTENVDRKVKKQESDRISQKFNQLKFSSLQANLHPSQSNELYQKKENHYATAITEIRTRRVHTLVSDNFGFVHNFAYGDKWLNEAQLCQDKINQLIRIEDLIFYFCDTSAGRYLADIERQKVLLEQQNKIGHATKFENLIVFITGKNQLHYFNQTDPGTGSTQRSQELPFDLVKDSKDLHKLRIKQLGTNLIVYKSSPNAKGIDTEFSTSFNLINFADYLYHKKGIVMTIIRTKDIKKVIKEKDSSEALNFEKFKMHPISMAPKKTNLVIICDNDYVFNFSLEKLSEFKLQSEPNEDWFTYARYLMFGIAVLCAIVYQKWRRSKPDKKKDPSYKSGSNKPSHSNGNNKSQNSNVEDYNKQMADILKQTNELELNFKKGEKTKKHR